MKYLASMASVLAVDIRNGEKGVVATLRVLSKGFTSGYTAQARHTSMETAPRWQGLLMAALPEVLILLPHVGETMTSHKDGFTGFAILAHARHTSMIDFIEAPL